MDLMVSHFYSALVLMDACPIPVGHDQFKISFHSMLADAVAGG